MSEKLKDHEQPFRTVAILDDDATIVRGFGTLESAEADAAERAERAKVMGLRAHYTVTAKP